MNPTSTGNHSTPGTSSKATMLRPLDHIIIIMSIYIIVVKSLMIAVLINNKLYKMKITKSIRQSNAEPTQNKNSLTVLNVLLTIVSN